MTSEAENTHNYDHGYSEEPLILPRSDGSPFRLESPPNFGSFYLFLPHSDLSVWVMEDTLLDKLRNTSAMARLAQIKSLSLLSFHGPNLTSEYIGTSKHSREAHSLVATMVAGEIARNNGLSKRDTVALEIATMLHDSGTPPHGDTVINIDRENLSEETNYHDVLGKDILKLLKKYNVTLPQLDALIRNEGLGGKILDIADRITYVMQDLKTIAAGPANYGEVGEYLDELDHLVLENPNLGNIYKDVKVDKDRQEPYFENPNRLGVFLKARALLHERFYMHPISQGRDLLFGNLVKRYYSKVGSKDKPFTPQNLRQLGDNDLEVFLTKFLTDEIAQKLGRDEATQILGYATHRSVAPAIDEIMDKFTPSHAKFPTQKEAEEFASEIQQDSNTYVIGVKKAVSFNAATSYLTLSSEGDIMPFHEVNPEETKDIESIPNSMNGYYVHYTTIEQNSHLGKLLKFLKSSEII